MVEDNVVTISYPESSPPLTSALQPREQDRACWNNPSPPNIKQPDAHSIFAYLKKFVRGAGGGNAFQNIIRVLTMTIWDEVVEDSKSQDRNGGGTESQEND